MEKEEKEENVSPALCQIWLEMEEDKEPKKSKKTKYHTYIYRSRRNGKDRLSFQ